MSNKFFPFTVLTGGGTGALDKLDGDSVSDGDIGIVLTDTYFYPYHLNATGGAAESSPTVIVPDTNPGTKNWELLSGVFNGATILGVTGFGTASPLSTSRLTVDTLTGQAVAFRLRNGDANRYRSDWSIDSSGITVNSYDDTGMAYLPSIFNSSNFQILIQNAGGSFSHTFGLANTRYAVLDGLRIAGGDTSNTIYQDANMGITATGSLTLSGSSILIPAVSKSGATQAAAGAAATEPWYTSGHATLPDNVMMIGV